MPLIIISLLIIAQTSVNQEKQLLQQGFELIEIEEYERALEVWGAAFTELEDPSFLIGREYIRLATVHNLESFYQTASSIYLWGLTAEMIESNRDALKQELNMLRPLVGGDTFKEWERLFQSENPNLYREIRLFWQERNPLPQRNYNPRLIEHWERIGYAQKNFTRANVSPYGTDDRGVAYVQYGEPDRIIDGILQAPRGKVSAVCSQLRLCDGEIMPDVVMNLERSPYFEIWIYQQPNEEMLFNLVLIFGDSARGGFGRVDTIEEFIPARAFSLSDRFNSPSPGTGANNPGEKMTPGMVLQWLYYEQLATKDFFFANRFDQLMFEWDRADPSDPRLGKHQGPVQEEQSKRITRENLDLAPSELSTYEKIFPEIPIKEFHYRLLDKNNQPIVLTFLESQPYQSFIEDLAFNQDVLFTDESTIGDEALGYFELTHGLVLKSEEGEFLNSIRQPSELIIDLQEDTPSSSVFTIPYHSSRQNAILYAELNNRHPDSRPRVETLYPRELRGLGRLETKLPEPLPSESDDLLIGDLIIGWQMMYDEAQNALIPFVVANNLEIPVDEELAVHLEIYNLQISEEGFTDFQVDYQVVPVRRFDWFRGQENEFSLSLNYETTEQRFVENLAIKTRELPTGRYKLQLKITDKIGGQEIETEKEFQLRE
jgi:GWxTD domain-containing protein